MAECALVQLVWGQRVDCVPVGDTARVYVPVHGWVPMCVGRCCCAWVGVVAHLLMRSRVQMMTAPLPLSGPLALANTTAIPAVRAFAFRVHGVQVEGFGGLAGPDKRSM